MTSTLFLACIRHVVQRKRARRLPKCRSLSLETRSAVVTLWGEGYTQRQIAKKLKISRSGVQLILQKKKETGSIVDRPRTGRPKVTTPRESRLLIRLSLRDRKATSKMVKREFMDITGKSLSTRTVRRRLNEGGLRGCVAVKKTMLTKKQKQKRLAWAKKHRNWTINVWSRVVWSDESIFQLIPARKTWVRRRPNERYNPECVVSTMKHGSGKVHVWGCMSQRGVGTIKVVEGRLDSKAYIKVISGSIKTDGRRLGGNNFIFQQDGAPCHTSKYSIAWLKRNGINSLPWTPQSPDLNPIEHLWEHIASQMDQKPCRNIEELKDLIFETWYSTKEEVTSNLVGSLPQHVRCVIKAKGGHTKY